MNSNYTKQILVFCSLVMSLGLNSSCTFAAPPKETVLNWSTATQNIVEGNKTVTLTVTAIPANRKDINIPYTVSGTALNPTDYNLTNSGSIFIPAGSTSGTLSFQLVDDNIFELA